MEEVLDFMTTFSSYIFSGIVLPLLARKLFKLLRDLVIYVFKPKRA